MKMIAYHRKCIKFAVDFRLCVCVPAVFAKSDHRLFGLLNDPHRFVRIGLQ